MLVMEIYTFTFKMVNKAKNSGSARTAELRPPLIRDNDTDTRWMKENDE